MPNKLITEKEKPQWKGNFPQRPLPRNLFDTKFIQWKRWIKKAHSPGGELGSQARVFRNRQLIWTCEAAKSWAIDSREDNEYLQIIGFTEGLNCVCMCLHTVGVTENGCGLDSARGLPVCNVYVKQTKLNASFSISLWGNFSFFGSCSSRYFIINPLLHFQFDKKNQRVKHRLSESKYINCKFHLLEIGNRNFIECISSSKVLPPLLHKTQEEILWRVSCTEQLTDLSQV